MGRHLSVALWGFTGLKAVTEPKRGSTRSGLSLLPWDLP